MSLGFEILKNFEKTYKLNLNLVSMPSIELFEKQPENYKKKILGNRPKVVIEAGSSLSWYKYLNENDLISRFRYIW